MCHSDDMIRPSCWHMGLAQPQIGETNVLLSTSMSDQTWWPIFYDDYFSQYFLVDIIAVWLNFVLTVICYCTVALCETHFVWL